LQDYCRQRLAFGTPDLRDLGRLLAEPEQRDRERVHKATKYVVTRNLDQLDWKKSLRIGGDVVDEVRRLKASDGPELHIWGSWKLLQTVIAAELIDEYRIMVYPVVLGKGKRLFENGVPPSCLVLVETLSTSKGVFFNAYRSAGPIKTESFAQ
jgi:dihydrofolate reductase